MSYLGHIVQGAVVIVLIGAAYVIGFSHGHRAGATEAFIETASVRLHQGVPGTVPREMPEPSERSLHQEEAPDFLGLRRGIDFPRYTTPPENPTHPPLSL